MQIFSCLSKRGKVFLARREKSFQTWKTPTFSTYTQEHNLKSLQTIIKDPRCAPYFNSKYIRKFTEPKLLGRNETANTNSQAPQEFLCSSPKGREHFPRFDLPLVLHNVKLPERVISQNHHHCLICVLCQCTVFMFYKVFIDVQEIIIEKKI